jgi:hypothetical protein
MEVSETRIRPFLVTKSGQPHTSPIYFWFQHYHVRQLTPALGNICRSIRAPKSSPSRGDCETMHDSPGTLLLSKNCALIDLRK